MENPKAEKKVGFFCGEKMAEALILTRPQGAQTSEEQITRSVKASAEDGAKTETDVGP